MKLHLPKSLRTALLSCLAAISPWSLTLATGAISSGLVAFSISSAYAVDETGDLTSNTNWNASTDHSAHTTTVSGSGTKLKVGNGSGDGSGSLNALDDNPDNDVVNLGTLTLEDSATLDLWAWTKTDRDISTDGKVKVAGAITLDNASIWMEDGSYYFSDVLNVKGTSTITSQWNKGVVLDAISGDADAELSLISHGRDSSGGALFVLGDGEAGNSSFYGTLVLNTNAADKVPTLVLNDATALQSAALKLGANTNAIMQLERVSAGAVYGAGDILITFINANNQTVTGHANPVLQITGNATDAQTFSGTMASNVKWQIGDGTDVASSRFDGATLNGSLVIETGSTAYLTGDNTFGTLTNYGTLHLSEGSSFIITSQAAYQGATITGLGVISGITGNTFTYGNGWLATYDATTGTATITDNSSIYWIDNGVDGNTLWSAADNWQGGVLPTASDKVRLGSDGAGRIVSFDGDATVGEVRVVAGDYGFVVSGNSTLTGTVYVAPVGATLTKSGAGILTLTNATANALSVTEGELVVNTLSLENGDTFTKNGAGTLTLTNVTANALSVTEGELVVNTLSLAHGSSFTKNGVGTMKLSNVSGILGKDVTVEAGELHITQTGDNDVATNTVYTVTVESGATLNDDRRLRLTGGSLTVTGGGIYELEGICLSGTGGHVTSLKVEADTVLHITGTTQSADGGQGSFMLSNWNAGNSINIEGLLVSDAGISDRDGSAVINIENGGTLQLNAGLSRTIHGGKDTTIEVKDGANLVVNGSSSSGTDYITTNLSDGSTVFTTSGATIANNMTYNGTVKLGAAADAELSLTAASPIFTNLTIMGSADKVSALDSRTVKEYAAGGTVKFTNALSGTSITLNAGAQFEATAGLTLTGALTLGANAEATLGGAVSIASLAGKNAGTLTFAGSLTSLALQDFNFGQEYEIGTVTNGNNVDWCALLNYSNTLHTITYENGVLISSYKEVLWSSPADNDITWGGADNWSVGGSSIALSGTENVVLGVIDTTVEQPVSSVIQIAANTTVAGVTVRDAYRLSVAEGAEFSFDSTTITFEEGGSLRKVGQGTLSMSLEDAKASKMNIAEGTLKIGETLMQVYHSSDTRVDLTALSSSTSGVLSIAASGNQSAPGKGTGTNVSHITLSDAFTGIVEVRSGKLHVLAENGGDSKGSDLGGATGLRLDGGGILITSSGTEFAGQSLSLNLEVGASGGYIDLFGGSGNVKDEWSSKHTGALTGSGVLTFIGMGEWVLAGDYSAFTGGLALGSESQYLYISSDMENLKSLDWNNAYQHATNKASVVVGYGNTAGVKMTVADKQTVSYDGSAIKLSNGSTFTHTGGVTVADNTTFNVTSYDANSSGIYNTVNVEFATANSKLAVAGKVVANITGSAAYTATCGTIDIASGATVNDNRALTIDGAYNITGAGTYNQLGTLALTENGVLTLSGKVSINSLAGNNAGVLTFAELSSLELKDFVIGEAYEIGTVTDGANVDWQSLMGYTDRRYSIKYDNGMLNSVVNDIVWSSAEDDDITWGGSDNWVMGGESVAVEATDSVLLGTIGDSGVSSTIQLAANTTVAGVTVQDAYSFSVAEGETYSFDAGSIVLDGGSLSKTGAGTLSMSLEDAVAAKLNIAKGTLSISGTLADTSPSEVSPIDMSALGGVGTLSITAAGVNGGTSDGTRTNVVLGNGFTGTLQVSGGQLDADSTTGGASLVVLDGATLTDTHGDGVHTVAWNIKVSDNDAYLRHFGHVGQDNRDSYATRLTGALTGSADAMLKVIASGEWFLAGDMSGYQGGLSIEGDTNYVTFESDATLASLTAVNNSHILVDNNATLTAPALAVSGTIYTGATEGATFNMGAVSIAADATLKLEGAGAHTLSTLAMGNNSTLELVAGTNAGITESAPHAIGNGNAVFIKLGEGATLTDAGSWQLTGSTMTVQGGGEYKLNSLVLSANWAGKTTVNVESGTTLHITGTATNHSKQEASFGLGHWNADNAVNVRGVLELECGISSYSGYSNTATITVENGGKIAFNKGLHAAGKDNAGVININGGGVLEVSGTNVSGTNLVTVNVATDGIVMGGNANGESKIANNLNFTGTGAYFGAKKGTSLTIAPEDGLTSMNWLVILGDGSEQGDSAGETWGAGGMVAFDHALTVNNNVYIREGGSLGVLGNITTPMITNMGELVFDGADTITLGQAIKNAGTVEILNAADTQFVLNNAMLEEQVGVSKTWTLVNNTGMEGLTGTVTGWNALGLENFLLDGSTLQLGDWDGVRITDGKVMLYMLSRYWDATGEEGVWNTGADANWREFEDATETVTFEANSRVTFTDTDETGKTALDKSVTVADAGVQAKSVTITGTGYVFSGGKVLVNQRLSALHDARFDSVVVIGSAAPLQLDVADGATLTLSTLETVSTQSYGGVSYGSGAFSKTGAGTLLITDAINGTITGATVSGGKLVLGVAGAEEAAKTVSLAVGSNTLTTAGGSLENVELLSSGTVTDYTGATAQANNVIKSADGVNYAMLTDVALRAGAATGYASLQKVAFAGNSTLSGYITYESTKQQRQMAVATGGTLTVSNLTFDLHGLSAGTKVLIENGAVADAVEGFLGRLEGWNSDNVTLLYSGIAVNSAAVKMNMDTAGVVELLTAEDIEASRLYWDGLVAGAASSSWDKSSANWSASAGTDGSAAFLALSNTYFGATPERGSKTVNAAQDMVMSNMFVTEGGYSFTGSRLATLGNMHITPESGAVSFANELVAQGNVTLRAEQGGSLNFGGMLQAGGTITANVEGALSFDNAVSAGGKVELNALNLEVNGALRSVGDVSISSGTTAAGGAGSLTSGESGSITGANVTINVNAGAESDTHYRDYVVESAGAITATAEGGKVSFTGNGAAHITGTVTADEIVVDTQSSNGIIFRQMDTDTLTITEGSYAALTDETSTGQQETSRIGTIQLGGRLGLTQFAGTYSGYNLVTTSATATVDFATIAKVTFASVKGEQLADGTYGSIVFNDSYRTLTVNRLETVNNITFGAGEYWAKLYNATGAIHGDLTVRGGGGLQLFSDNIMANGSGKWYISGPLYLQGTTQTLAGNAVYLDGAVISGTHASGMNFTANSQIHYTGNNTISANMTVADGKVLTIEAGPALEDILMLNGNLQGEGEVQLTGSGRVSLGAANAFTGTMTVQNHTQLRLDNTQALASANLVLAQNGVLIVDRSAVETPYTIGALALGGGALQINNLMAMDAVSAQDAALKLGELSNPMTNTLDLTLSFTSGELQTMKTYNLFTADGSYPLEKIATMLNLNLSVVNGTETLRIADNQYKLVYDATANVIAIRTMLGNIWDGGADGNGDGTWSTDNTDKNWSGSDYDQLTAYNDAIFADLTGEGIGGSAVVTIEGTVNPGEIYFEADSTKYELIATAGGAMLAAGNVIHKAGKADVTLNLANNGTAANALGGLDLQAGATKLASDLAVAGEVSVAAGDTITLQTGANKLLMVVGDDVAYTAQGTYSGLTMDATGIAGVSGAPGTVTNGIISGAAELSNLNLTGMGTLDGVTIGSGVNVATGATYTLSGHITFLDTLQNAGTVNFAEGVTVELGGLSSKLSADGTSYSYQLVKGGTINGLASGITAQDVFINGVNLSAGLANGIATVLSSDEGTVSISIGKELEGGGVDGSIAVTSWDARWGEVSGQPSLAKRYTGDYNGAYYFAEDSDSESEDSDSEYAYNKVVNETNANKVNSGNAIVVYLSAEAFGAEGAELAAPVHGEDFAGYETWVYDSSDVYQVVAGQHFSSAQTGFKQNADTHLYVDANNTQAKAWVVGGSWNVAQQADSYVTVENGKINSLIGAGVFAAAQFGTAHVYVDGGTVTNIYGAGYENGAHLTANKDKNANAVEMLLTGGTITNVYGGAGANSAAATPSVTGNIAVTVEGNATITTLYGGSMNGGEVTGNIAVTVEGNANITTLYGGSMNGGEVTGNINLDLISGSITTVHAAGASGSTLTGNVTVTLHNDDVVTGALYGGKETTNEQTTNKVNGDYTSTLSFAEANTTYDMTGITVQGFDTFTLADGAHVKVSTTESGFATDSASGGLTISGHGKVELVGNTDFARNITLTKGATLWFNSDYAGNSISSESSRSILTATAGTTIEITGQPTDGDGVCVWLDLAGHGVDGKGALYKALVGAETTPSGKVAMPRVTISESASINAEDNIYFIECYNNESELILKGNTLTKVGEADLVLYNSTVTDTSDNDTDAGVDGTIFVKEGTLGTGYGMRAAKTNIVLSSGSELNIIDIGTAATNIGALSGSGSVALNKGLVITTSSAGSYGKGSDWMTEGADDYSQFSADSGFAYGVYSGTISGSNSLSVKGDAVQYLSGSDSTFTGGVHMQDSATLYLMAGSSGSAVQGNSTVTAGVVGTGAIAWDSEDAKLYLGNGVQVFNAGTTNVADSNMIIGVEAAPRGDALSNYVGVNSKGADGVLYITVGGKEYVEIDTHNLQSISCDGMYADGTAYVAGAEIDRNKMLLVEKSVWELNTATVAGFSGNGYNEATYSGVLSGKANLVKVGLGTLILDQTNTYTGKTIIREGSLVLKGWAQIGSVADGASINVEQQEDTSLLLAYDGSYGDEITGIANNITLTGTGDERWKTDAEHMATSALISDVGANVAFTLSGDISGDGGILHSGAGTLVLSGDSSYKGGMHATRGVVEVQSATGLGAGVVNIESTADLHVTVEEGTTDARVTTTLAAAGTTVQGDVVISGTESTERILNIAVSTNDDKSQGYTAPTTTVGDNGTLLVNGKGVTAATGTLRGSGTVAVSDATGSGASATVDQMTAYTGDFVVEGNNASITVKNGSYSGGSISVSGNDAVLSMKGDITITNGESLSLSSRGNAGAENDAAYVTTTRSVSVASGATLSVSDAATSYEYNLQNLQAAASLNGVHDLVSVEKQQSLIAVGNNAGAIYDKAFDTSVAMNKLAAGAVKADGGLTLASGATYETAMANTSLLGGSLTLESGLTLSTTLDLGQGAIDGAGRTTQLVLFSDVRGVNFVQDNITAGANSGIYYTKAENYISGSYIDEKTWLVYDSGAGVVYLDGIVPEPTTATLSLLALAALAARRRRR